MAITAKCPNGHVLKVKDEFAGKSGLCPHCHSRVFVPMPVHTTEKARISDDEILGLLGPGRHVEPELSPPPSESVTDDVHEPPKLAPAFSMPGSSLMKKQKTCPTCGHIAPLAFTHCSRCGTPLPNPEREKKK